MFARVMPQQPGWKGDRYDMGFEVTRRQVYDDVLLATLSSDFLQLCRQPFDVPVKKELFPEDSTQEMIDG